MSKAIIRYKIEVVVDIDLKNIENYLLSKGWRADGPPWGQYGKLFAKNNEKVLLVTTDKIGDWNARMNEFIFDLAKFEKRTVPELLEDLTK